MFTSQHSFYVSLQKEEEERQKQQPAFGSFGGSQVQNTSTFGLFGGVFGQPTQSAFSAQNQQSTRKPTEYGTFGQNNKQTIPKPNFELNNQSGQDLNKRQRKQQDKQDDRGQDYPEQQRGGRNFNGNKQMLRKRNTIGRDADQLDQQIQSLKQIDEKIEYSNTAKRIYFQQLGSVDLNDWIQDPLATHLEFQIKEFPDIIEDAKEKINYKIIRQILQHKQCFTTLGEFPTEISVDEYFYKKQREAAAVKLIMMINERRQGRTIISSGVTFHNAIIETSIEEFIDTNFETIKNAKLKE